MKLSELLRNRRYVYQHSSETLEEITDGPKRTVYLGVDPTADSIHVGNLAVYMLLRRFADAGHKVILVIGGGTGMIGDPKPDAERELLDVREIQARSAKLRNQAQRLLGAPNVQMVNNADWLTKLNLIEFLRDTGKHFTVNSLIKKDAIHARMESDEGISYTEFSYPLLQAYDFWHLYKEYDCNVQIGGSDQWGNIVAGVDLIRRKESKIAYALTLPLIIDKATRRKFGKSEGNAIWLDPEKTSPYQFYQFWLNASDESVEDYLKLFTLLSDDEIRAVMREQRENSASRPAQKKLAQEVTALVHGKNEAEKAEKSSAALFSGSVANLSADVLKTQVALGDAIVGVLLSTKLASSKREARQFLEDGAVTLNGETMTDRPLAESDFKDGKALLKRGKRNVCVLALK
ncbi:tyrosine--tRNA ligase [Candidatus Kaiserbacteria bacterium]|nr:tyrosine--tRNA ligase [Candidatus Kaiserbacteria bacterium]